MSIRNIVSVSLALLAAGCASQQASRSVVQVPAVQVPDMLKPGANEALALVVPAKGGQIYECREKKDQAGAYDWAFVAPEASLFDAGGKRIGRHYAGPSWEAADGSKIVGTVKQRVDAPASGAAGAAAAIPWLLLEAKSVGREGAFSKVTSVQRVSTVGGVAPPNGCSLAGFRVEIPYTADYYFYTAR